MGRQSTLVNGERSMRFENGTCRRLVHLTRGRGVGSGARRRESGGLRDPTHKEQRGRTIRVWRESGVTLHN